MYIIMQIHCGQIAEDNDNRNNLFLKTVCYLLIYIIYVLRLGTQFGESLLINTFSLDTIIRRQF